MFSRGLEQDRLPAALLGHRFRWFGTGLAVGCLLVIGFWIRQPAAPDVSSVEGYFSPNVQYGPWYLANNYRLFSPSDELPVVSNYTSGLSYGAIDFTHTFFTGAALVLARSSNVEGIGDLYRHTPWQGLLLLPLAAFAVYSRFAKSVGRSMSPAALLILYAFAAFSNYPMIVWAISGGFSSPLGWFIFYAVYLAVLVRSIEPEFRHQWTFLLILTLLLAQPTYHTIALALTVIVLVIWISESIFKQRYLSSTLVWLTVVVFLVFLMYHAVATFSDYGHLLASFLADIYRGRDQQRLQYSLGLLDASLGWHIANYTAVFLPVAWVGFILVLRKFRSRMDMDLVRYQFMWLVTLVPLGVMFFAWDGVFAAYARLLQYGTLLAIASAAFLLASRRTSRLPLAAAALVCVFVSITLVQRLDVTTSNYVTKDEVAAIEWISSQYGCRKVVFTDFRIGSAMGYWNCYSVIGPNIRLLLARNRTGVLDSLLYTHEAPNMSSTIDTLSTIDGRRADLMLMSRRFTDPHIGFVLPDARLKPMTEEQWEAYKTLSGWRVSFENDSTMVLVRDHR